MFVRVTEEDIRLGVQRDTTSCPLARALKRRTGDQNASVYTTHYVYKGNNKDLSRKGHKFILKFDRTGVAKPGIIWI